jgi:sterol desaturase/sphingolipid hydroxylase (fatty acid hydroxylase superfamily)
MSGFDASLAMLRPGSGGFLLLAAALIAIEWLYSRLADHDRPAYDAGETAATLGVAIGHHLSRVLTGSLAATPFAIAYEHRLADLPHDRLWTWLVLFIAVELAYYVFHRASHRIRWFWATHAVHHSATRFNLSAALRLGWTGQLSGAFLFFLPLAAIGFHPLAIVAILAAGLVYQFFLHTSLDIHLGPLEWVLNTPRHHRVHHASNESCLDRNYGSTLIVFDRLFGTFAAAPCDEPLRYGLRDRAPSNNPIRIALGEWGILLADVRRARGLRRKLAVLFSPP